MSLMIVKCCGLLSEMISNVSFAWTNFRGAQEMQLAFGILVFVFGLLEGILSCYESRVRENSNQSGINAWV